MNGSDGDNNSPSDNDIDGVGGSEYNGGHYADASYIF